MSRYIALVVPKVADGEVPKPSHTFRLDPPTELDDHEWVICEVRERLGLVPGTVHEVDYEVFDEGLCNHELDASRVLTVCDMRTEAGRDAADFLGAPADEPS